MTQNTSHAVMAQRHEAHDSLDDFPTPPWAVRALLEHVIAVNRHHDTVWEPACNRGYMVKGRCDPHASTATAYCWVVWTKEPTREATEFLWIPPCRSKLERVDDYFGSLA